MKTRIAIAAIFLICAGTALGHEETQNLTIPADGITLLDIDCGGGFLKVRGMEGLQNIEVEAEIVVSGMSQKKAKDFIERKLELSLKKRGQRAYLVSTFKPHFSIISMGSKIINLTVNIPKTMNLMIDDGSGDTQIQNVIGRLEIDDSSGGLTIENIKGDVMVDDSSGDLIMEDIQGEITIEDGSGSIRIQDALGSVTISDGSGSIRVSNIEKDVIIKRAGSGGVSINNVKGRVIR
ncbi:hypothetical protein ACFLT9_07895 [Acidobacteriota bacterium]